LNKLKGSLEQIKRANSLLRHYIDEHLALRLSEIDNEVSKIIKNLLFEISNPKHVIEFSEKMSNRELLCFLAGPEIFIEINQLKIKSILISDAISQNFDFNNLNHTNYLPKKFLNTEKSNRNIKKNSEYILISGSADDDAKKLL